MPGKREKTINELNKHFGIFTYDVLSDYEKNVFDKHRNLNISIDERREELKKEYAQHAHNSIYVGSYVEKLMETDDYIKDNYAKIDTLKVNSKEIKEKADMLNKPIDELSKESAKYQTKIDTLNAKINDATNKVNKKLEEEQKKIDKKALDKEIEIAKRKQEIKTRLSDYQIEESKFSVYLNKLILQKDSLITKKSLIDSSSKEFKELTKEIEKIDEDITKHTLNFQKLQMEIPNIQKEADLVDKEFNDTTYKDTEYQKAFGKSLNELKKLDPLKAEANGYNNEKTKIDNQINELKANKDLLETNVSRNEREVIALENDCLIYAKEDALKKKNEVTKSLNELDQYETIVKALGNKVPKITSTGIINGLGLVKKSYSDYYNNHSFIGRLFKFLPFTSAHHDYQEFSEIRTKYMELSNIKQNEIDHYLDHNELIGDLFEKSINMDKEVVDKILTNNTVMDHRTYKKDESASVSDYIKAVDGIYTKELMGKQNNMGYAFISTDKGLLILNELGNIKRTSPSEEVDLMIKKISNVVSLTGSVCGRTNIIKDEIENALKPADERIVFEHKMPSYLKEMYDAAKLEEDSKLESEENAILFGNNKTFAKVTVNEEEIEESEEYQEDEKEVISLDDNGEVDRFLDL